MHPAVRAALFFFSAPLRPFGSVHAQLYAVRSDSATVQALKRQCNQLIEAYNRLPTPFNEEGAELSRQISFLLDKIVFLKRV